VEQGDRAVGEAVRTVHRDAEGASYRTVRAVGRDDVRRLHDPRRAGPAAQRHRNGLGSVGDVDHLRAKLDLGGGQRAQMREQHRLEVVLRHAGGTGRAQHRALLPGWVADRQGYPGVRVGEGLAHPHLPLDIRPAGADFLREAPAPVNLHRPGADDGGPRQARQFAPPLHEQRSHALPGQRDRRGEARRPGADDQRGEPIDSNGSTFRRTV
jgi:hypothetical protein